MNAKSDELINELISASIAFGREKEPDWQTRIETARCALKAHIEELEAKAEVQESEATSCEFCGRKIGNIAPPEVK